MFVLESPAFDSRGTIPARFTGDGANLSPPLHWDGAPAGTRSVALIVDDPSRLFREATDDVTEQIRATVPPASAPPAEMPAPAPVIEVTKH